ncbi:hypothetical protein [Ruegeria atlantica]|uniref:hypothetical protein n=1 Tax=Ruegeria atlantica TaxID=81569 RepID=UPI0024952ACD|nr:hypothetical protein [Ruegeria atlantica]
MLSLLRPVSESDGLALFETGLCHTILANAASGSSLDRMGKKGVDSEYNHLGSFIKNHLS